MTRLPTVVLAAVALVGFVGAAAIPAGWLVWWWTAPTVLPPLLGVLALGGFFATPALLPARSRQRAKNAVGLSAHLPAAPADGTGAALCRGARRVAHKGRRRASLPRRRTGAPPLGVGRPHSNSGREPVDRLTPHYRPGRASVHQGGSA